MITTGTLRPMVLILAVAGLVASAGAAPVAAASFSVRLEAGAHAAYTFDTAGAISASRIVTLAAPATVSASARSRMPNRGVYFHISAGTLAGWWVREDATSYYPGYTGTVTYSPPAVNSIGAGQYELYSFDAAGNATTVTAWRAVRSTMNHVDRFSVIRGRGYVHVVDGTLAGRWMRGTPSAPTRITCTAGSPATGTTARLVSSVPSAAGEIALTFDMGGRLDPALAILRFLEVEGVCATVFPTGVMARTTTGQAVLAQVRAHPELFELGNHTVHHCDLRNGGGGSACPATRPSAAFVTSELRTADSIIAGYTGRHTTPYWRPPYGAVDSTLATVAATAGYPYTIMWSTDTIDWRPVADGGPSASAISAKVLANRSAGDVVLMHLGGYNTLDALASMVLGLRAAGYTPTTISALYRTGH